MKKSILLAIALIATLVAVPAFASVQNVKIGGDVTSTFVHRNYFDLNASTVDQQNVFLTQTTLEANADLTDKVSATIALINERVWGDGSISTTGTDMDLLRAYVTLRELLYSPLTVIIGRQAFHYGNSFIFDTAGQNNAAPADSGLLAVAGDLTKQTNMDAFRAILNYDPLTIEGFIALTHQHAVLINDADDNQTIYGLVGTYKLGDKMDSLIEAYIFDRKDNSSNDTDAELGNKVDHLKVVGGRFSTNPIEGLNVQGEVAHQGGVDAASPAAANNQRRDAWGMQGIVNYQVPVLKEYKPMLQYVFTKVYGDTNTLTDQDQATWDAFYENQGGGTIYNTLFSLSNAVIHTLSLSANPMEDLTTKLTVTKLYTHQRVEPTSSFPLSQPDDTSGTTTNAHGGRYLGTEVDVDASYAYTEDVKFGLSIGVYKPGSVFVDNQNAKQVLASVDVAF